MKKINIQYFIKKIFFPLYSCSWKYLWKQYLVCLFYSSHIFTNNYHNVLYVYLCTEAI